jgi:phosphoserine phosphatase
MIIFDMDGVIFQGHNFWLDLHKAYGTEKDAIELAKKFLHTTRESDYIYLSKYTTKFLWKGKSASTYYDLIKKRAYQPGIHKLFDYIHNKHIDTAIISSGAYDLALRAQADLGVNIVLANRIDISNSVVTGEVDVMVPDNSKDKVGKNLMRELGIQYKAVAFLGDTDSDAPLSRIVGLPISYNSSSKKLRNVCKFNLRYGELEKVIDILDKSLGA